MTASTNNSFNARSTLKVGSKSYVYYSLPEAAKSLGNIDRMPFSLKVLLENLLRYEDGRTVSADDVKAMAQWLKDKRSDREISYRPARVLMQDFTGVPAVVDLAAMRDAMVALGGDPRRISPLSPVDLVIDHSVAVDAYGTDKSFADNVKLEFERNNERYAFLRWGQTAFANFRVVPPGTGICHQVNVEYLAQVVWTNDDAGTVTAYPDTLVGTDSHTTMVNGLAVLGWGVGGIEAEAAMLGQPVSMVIPEVIGFKLTGKMIEGTTATDLVLTVTQMLRKKGVVNKFVEFFGPGLDNMTLADRATIANMAPEYGATCGFFPIDRETINFLRFTGRDSQRVDLVEAYAKAQGMWREASTPDPVFTDTLELDMGAVVSSLAGPKRPQDRVPLTEAAKSFAIAVKDMGGGGRGVKVEGRNHELRDGDVVIAAITSCTNTSNPSVLVGAGLLARNALKKGLRSKPWVKTSLAPGSQVVTDYLDAAGLSSELDKLGFNLVGYGCTTCIGNSGPLDEPIAKAVETGDLVVCSVLSGNRNFEGRVNPHVKANYLASPPLVVAYALAGTMTRDLLNEPLGMGDGDQPVYLKDIWPSNQEIQDTIRAKLTPEMYRHRYANVSDGGPEWKKIEAAVGLTYKWNDGSTYVKNPPYFVGMKKEPGKIDDILKARTLVQVGDSITTDHISPAGNIKKDSPAGEYLIQRQVRPADFNQYGARRGNHDVMMRGTFANIRLKNEVAPGTSGGMTRHMPAGQQMSIYDAAMKYQADGVPLVVIAGKEYGTGSSRDWAAKGTTLLGIKAVIAETYERIHRSNLVGMGVLPLQFKDGASRQSLKLDGSEVYDFTGIKAGIKPGMDVDVTITRANGEVVKIKAQCRIDTADEVEYYRHGGILQYVLRNMMKAA
ncbi:MAG: aconitate hydratase AcnA [Alphaproteobacteria bacterium]|nr:aconitate hydratase AcnA [Alphaproteobacteria bacterium]